METGNTLHDIGSIFPPWAGTSCGCSGHQETASPRARDSPGQRW